MKLIIGVIIGAVGAFYFMKWQVSKDMKKWW